MNNSDDISKILASLDTRIQKIENYLNLDSELIKDESDSVGIDKISKSFELQVGKFWLAKIGILIFTVGLIFLILSSFKNMPAFFPSLLGYIFTAIYFMVHIFGKKWLHYIDNYILSTGFILLFFSTLRLAYFSEDLFITNYLIEVLILVVVSISILVYSLINESSFLTTLSLLICFITSLLIDNPLASLIFALILSLVVIWTARKFNWHPFLIFGIVLSYIVHIIWFIGNPLFSELEQSTPMPTVGLIFILITFIVYSLGLMNKQKQEKEEFLKITSIFINSLLAASLFVIVTYVNSIESLSLFSFIGFAVFLFVALLSWIYERSKYATFFYSIFGYMLLSISIISGFEKPDFFIILSWQSLLVVTTAIWFRSRIIIVANFIIYLMILIAFLFLSSEVTYISISFGIVALLSARFLNWKKKELELNSEGMRNAYLICAFIIFPYSLYNSMPEGFVTISWIGVAIVYYVLSLVLQNIKYRWLAFATLLLSVVYVIFFGIAELSSELRILTFIILGIVLLVISLLYSKRKIETDEVLENDSE